MKCVCACVCLCKFLLWFWCHLTKKNVKHVNINMPRFPPCHRHRWTGMQTIFHRSFRDHITIPVSFNFFSLCIFHILWKSIIVVLCIFVRFLRIELWKVFLCVWVWAKKRENIFYIVVCQWLLLLLLLLLLPILFLALK